MSETTPTPKDENAAALGSRFRSVRESRHVKLKDLATHLGTTINTIRWHEAGATLMRLDMLVAAAEFIGVTLHDLTTLEDGELQNGRD